MFNLKKMKHKADEQNFKKNAKASLKNHNRASESLSLTCTCYFSLQSK